MDKNTGNKHLFLMNNIKQLLVSYQFNFFATYFLFKVPLCSRAYQTFPQCPFLAETNLVSHGIFYCRVITGFSREEETLSFFLFCFVANYGKLDFYRLDKTEEALNGIVYYKRRNRLFFLYKKPGEGPSSKNFLFLAQNCMFLVPKVS